MSQHTGSLAVSLSDSGQGGIRAYKGSAVKGGVDPIFFEVIAEAQECILMLAPKAGRMLLSLPANVGYADKDRVQELDDDRAVAQQRVLEAQAAEAIADARVETATE